MLIQVLYVSVYLSQGYNPGLDKMTGSVLHKSNEPSFVYATTYMATYVGILLEIFSCLLLHLTLVSGC